MNASRSFLFAGTLVAITLGGFGSAEDVFAEPSEEAFRLQSPSFAAGESVPSLYTCDGNNASPPLVWSDPPHPARSFLITLTDKDAQSRARKPFVHWILYNVSSDTRVLGESLGRNRLPSPAREGTNDFRRTGYDGPCPPSGEHRYVFTVYALDATLELPFYPSWREVEPAIANHVLASTTLEATYAREPKK